MCRRRRNQEADLPNEPRNRSAWTCRTKPTIAAPWRWAATGPVPYRRPWRGAPTRSVRELLLRRRSVAPLVWLACSRVYLLVSLLGCSYAGLPARLIVSSSGCSFVCFLFACLQVVCLVVRLFVLLRLLGFCIAWLLVASILGRALPMWNFCSSDKHAQSEGAGGRKVPRAGTHSTPWTLRWKMQANPISTAALRLKQRREYCKVLYSRWVLYVGYCRVLYVGYCRVLYVGYCRVL
jgi:hypothetical protein